MSAMYRALVLLKQGHQLPNLASETADESANPLSPESLVLEP